jgi:hypothetical protein
MNKCVEDFKTKPVYFLNAFYIISDRLIVLIFDK